MEKLCDLHTHSTFSDGTFSPAQLIHEAQRLGLSAIALTDHNTVAGLPDFLRAAEGSSVEAVPGIEFSTDYQDEELHIVTLFVRPEHYGPITTLTDEMNLRKQQSNLDLIENLNRSGYAIDYQSIKARMPTGEPNRALIAAELTRLGYTSDNKEAFHTLLGKKCGYYHPPKRVDVFELIGFVRSMGLVPVLAHPFLSLKEENRLAEFLGPAAEAGLQGMETRYPLFSEEQTQTLEELASRFGLAPSGGSDFHGENKPEIGLGTGTGSLEVPLSFLQVLREKISSDFQQKFENIYRNFGENVV